ncbi:hypothetical protein IFM61606_02649 [Aspergillus udagawae]|uniref:C2H2-type domain-containing protein n=1 Tax=Aspergillus udagawae TaxID=91492 RepID=A0ABQ1ARA1_9EURO|nr:hypothetical protein IFM51744_06408 [Aspergillus udagawae]GFF86637.1 hypothetical protein IFM53868_04875 [Aspergillus udagawae]GFG08543.1 hypothetical protein IFM5058_03978 [Aspergillus udagawae]GFG22782.1 hypothetical protein IFM61606_02649 [Aspergillus udagawae]
MATYREAWGLFQDEPMFPSSSTASLSSGTGPGMRMIGRDQSAASSTISKTELVSELQRLRQELQELQSASHPNQNSKISDQPEPFSSTTQPDNSLPPREPGSERSETLRCWEPCCNGRLFSNRSNLIRHQRERRGESAKLRCSFCDAVFLRSSARNAHEAARRCRR